MTDNPYEGPEHYSQPPVKPPVTLRTIIINTLVIVGILGVMVLLLLPFSRRSAGGAARRMSCSNNLKQIGIGLLNYHDTYGEFPPAYTVDDQGKPLHSWRTLILPFIEQNALYESIDLSKPWDDPVNKLAMETRIPAYQCPSVQPKGNLTNYLAVVTSQSCLRPIDSSSIAEITDDTNSTLLVMEFPLDQAVPWGSPEDANQSMVLDFGSAAELPHQSGAQVTMADASVRFIPKKTTATTLWALITCEGNEKLDDDSF